MNRPMDGEEHFLNDVFLSRLIQPGSGRPAANQWSVEFHQVVPRLGRIALQPNGKAQTRRTARFFSEGGHGVDSKALTENRHSAAERNLRTDGNLWPTAFGDREFYLPGVTHLH